MAVDEGAEGRNICWENADAVGKNVKGESAF